MLLLLSYYENFPFLILKNLDITDRNFQILSSREIS